MDKEDYQLLKQKLISTNKELIAVNALRDKLFSVIAQDIHEPLANLVNLSELLAEEMKNDCCEKNEIVKAILDNARATFKKADNLIDWYITKKTGEIFDPTRINLSYLVMKGILLTKVTAEAKGIHIHTEIPEEIDVYADRNMLDIVVRNLISNAIKFTGENGVVNISAVDEGRMVVLNVQDTGVGIEPEKVQLLFQDIKVSGSRGTEGEEGIGVGLLKCRHCIQQNGGEIWVESTPGEGSNFYISIPKYLEFQC